MVWADIDLWHPGCFLLT